MENASKALIIAGAILLAILIISLGIMIYNQAAGVVNNNAMSEVEVTQFNAKFTQYEGKNLSGAQVNSMLQVVLAHNLAQDTDTEGNSDRQVAVVAGNDSGVSLAKNATTITNRAKTSSSYTVTCSYTNGLVSSITVSKNK